MGLPQERQFSDGRKITLTTPTSEQFKHRKSIVVPPTRSPRLPAATLDEARRAFASCQARSPGVALPSDEVVRKELASVIGDRAPLMWERAMAQLPENGKTHVATWNAIMTDDHLTPRLKAELAFITAMNNRAWYAAAHAAHRLDKLGASSEDLASLLGSNGDSLGKAAAAYRLAAKSTTDPHLITDADLAAVREEFSDRQTAQIMQVISMANLFDRFTEALRLPLEDSIGGGDTLSRR
jgi:alkylhydroperoxidase family enzyme